MTTFQASNVYNFHYHEQQWILPYFIVLVVIVGHQAQSVCFKHKRCHCHDTGIQKWKFEVVWNKIRMIAIKMWNTYHRYIQKDSLCGNDLEESMNQLRRKKEFLQNKFNKMAYGYKYSQVGYIDKWRAKEFPGLIHPLLEDMSSAQKIHSNSSVYLDFSGAALPTQKQLREIYLQTSSNAHQIMGNPHSGYSLSSIEIERAKQIVLEFLGCDDGKYDLIFTSGTTDALRILSLAFPWKTGSTLVYSKNSHTSVVGMRNHACSRGGVFKCVTVDQLLDIKMNTLQGWCDNIRSRIPNKNLIVFPLECNASGYRFQEHQVKSIAVHTRKYNESKNCNKWYTLLDIAKAASTGPVSISKMNIDFACLSFYKVFGTPTGLGALIVKKSTSGILLSDNESIDKMYFGGGAVDAILPDENFIVPRRGLNRLTNGTVHYRGIAELGIGFKLLENLGGMDAIALHTRCISLSFVNRLKNLRHTNGKDAVMIYEPWSSFDTCKLDKIKKKEEMTDFIHKIPGATVSFNIKRHDGSFVGYSEVTKLADLSSPRLQFRTGCFCNTGFCQSALKLSNTEIKSNFASGHVCGDENDIINNNPTGAIRISFGKDSTWEDMDEATQFIKRYFVGSSSNVYDLLKSSLQNSSEGFVSSPKSVITGINVFPIKSCGAMKVDKWNMQENGKLLYDREFALTGHSGIALRLNSFPKMTLINPEINLTQQSLIVRAPGMSDLIIDLNNAKFLDKTDKDIYVCGNECNSITWGDSYVSDWFTSFLGIKCWLVRYKQTAAEIPPLLKPQKAFANEAPLLLLSQESVDVLNFILTYRGEEPVDARYFRPNLVVSLPYKHTSTNGTISPEDILMKLNIINQSSSKSTEFQVIGKCSRCSMVDYCPSTGTKGKTLSALAEYRRDKGRIFFGVFLKAIEEPSKNGTCIQVGDVLEI